jgi:hypothetical protein
VKICRNSHCRNAPHAKSECLPFLAKAKCEATVHAQGFDFARDKIKLPWANGGKK